jgi:outer membrane protein, multidrug efflux system
MKPRILTSMFVAALLAACGTAPTPTTPKAPTLAATFAQAPQGAAASEPAELFWRGFQDTELDALVAEALRANTDVRIALARVQEARALATLAGAGDLPSVGAAAGAARSRVPDGSGGSSTGNSISAGLEASWEIDLFGRRASERAAARADLAASESQVQAVRLAVTGDVARSYFELRTLQERLRVAQESLMTQREALKLVQARLDAGRGTALDTERAKALVFGTEALLPALELQAVLASHRIAVLLGQPPGALQARLAAVKPLPGLQAVSLAAVGSPEQLLRRRPDLIAAEQQAAAAAARVGQAHKARFPKLTLSGTLGLNAGRIGDLGDSASFVYNLGAQLAYSLFDNGANQALVDAAQARNEAAVLAYDKAVLLALEDAEGALAGYTRSQQQAQSLFGAAMAADKAAEIARGRFSAGVSDFLAVLDAERERLAARDRLAQAQVAAAVSVVTVYKALGGGLGTR